MKKAIALISGGLDSTLAASLIQQQGIDIIPLNFKIPFYPRDKKIRSQDKDSLSWVRDNLGIDLKVVDISNDFLELVENPKHGFGSNINPCIDCKILMLRKARELMKEWGAAFVVTGEVLGQRPMSQYRQALMIIDKESGLEGLVLRPLSARLLAQTIPEKEGWVSRNKLLNFSGRSRRPQMVLAKTLDINDYPCSAGGCLLTDPQFARRLRDLITHEELNLNNVELLKTGRHFRLSEKAKLVVGRDEKENARLLYLTKEDDYLFMPVDIGGPTALGRGLFSEELIKLSSKITCRYCDLNGKASAQIVYRRVPEKEEKRLRVCAVLENQLADLRI